MARTYCQVAGIVLLAVGVLGFVWPGIPGVLSINEPAEIALHLVTGILATAAGFAGGYGRWSVLYAQVFGVIYILLGVLGFVVPDLPVGIHLDIGCNVVHLVLGVWGIWAGFFAGEARTSLAGA